MFMDYVVERLQCGDGATDNEEEIFRARGVSTETVSLAYEIVQRAWTHDAQIKRS